MRGLVGIRRGAFGAAMLAAALALPIVGAASAGEPPATASAADARVKIEGLQFKPFKLTVPRGAEVAFVNRDSVAHTATRMGSFDTGRIKAGKTKTVRFGTRGTYGYGCKIHPSMRGKIVVN